MTTSENRARLQAQLKRQEKEVLFPYMDCCGKPWRLCSCLERGKLTIGIGRNLDDVGITTDESSYMNTGDVDRVIRGLYTRYKDWFPKLDEVRQAVLVNMAFNLGLAGLAGFTTFLTLVASGKYVDAADDLAKTAWAGQVGHREVELAMQMRTGQWQG